MNIIEIIKITAELLSATAVIGGVVFACYRWFLKQKKQDEDIKQIKEENTLICFGLQGRMIMKRKEKEKVFKSRKLARKVAKANMKKEGIKQVNRKFKNNNWRRYVFLVKC